MTSRVRCCVPFCRRTIDAEKLHPSSEWICGKHWSAVPIRLRRVWSRYRRQRRRGLIPYGVRSERLWSRLKRAAIEAAAGI